MKPDRRLFRSLTELAPGLAALAGLLLAQAACFALLAELVTVLGDLAIACAGFRMHGAVGGP